MPTTENLQNMDIVILDHIQKLQTTVDQQEKKINTFQRKQDNVDKVISEIAEIIQNKVSSFQTDINNLIDITNSLIEANKSQLLNNLEQQDLQTDDET